jgi:hypothetical protein
MTRLSSTALFQNGVNHGKVVVSSCGRDQTYPKSRDAFAGFSAVMKFTGSAAHSLVGLAHGFV